MFGIRPPWPFTSLEDLAIPGVSILILFLAYTSQYLFYYIEPGPLTKTEAIWFNVFVLGIWWCYDRACFVEAGPKGWVGKVIRDEGESDDEAEDRVLKKGMRWCKKCDAVKPPRAHHCRKCGRYTISPFCFDSFVNELWEKAASQKWTTTAPGPQTASRIQHFPTSSASSCTP
jgi:palmitoyltransferase